MVVETVGVVLGEMTAVLDQAAVRCSALILLVMNACSSSGSE